MLPIASWFVISFVVHLQSTDRKYADEQLQTIGEPYRYPDNMLNVILIMPDNPSMLEQFVISEIESLRSGQVLYSRVYQSPGTVKGMD